MIKFAQEGAKGEWNVFLGITIENLKRIGEHMEPIVFPAEQVGLGEGRMAIGTAGMGAALRAQLGGTVRCLELTQAEADALTSGAPVERSLRSLGFSRSGLALVFLGSSEEAIVESLRELGLVTGATKVTTLDAKSPPVELAPPAPKRETIVKPQLVLSGLFFVALGVLGVVIGKNAALGVLIAAAGVACAVWGLRFTPPRR